MRQLIRRCDCLRQTWNQSGRKDVLFRVKDSTRLQERRQSLSSLYVSIPRPQKQHDNSPGDSTVSVCTTKGNNQDGVNGIDQVTSGNDDLTNLYHLMKHYVQQTCVSSYISQLIAPKCDKSLTYKDSQWTKERNEKQNMLKYFIPTDYFVRSEKLPDVCISLDKLSRFNMCGPHCNIPLCRQLLKSCVQSQLSSYYVSHCGNGIKVHCPVQLHQVRHYSINQNSTSCFRYSGNKNGGLLSGQCVTPSVVHCLFSSQAVNTKNWHQGVTQTHILSLKPWRACVLIQRWISKKEYNFPELKEDDLEESFMRGGGAGGQAVAKTNNCVLLVHKPTGIQLKVHVSRSVEENRKRAREMMITKLDFHYNGENSFAEQKRAERKKANRKKKKKAELVREKMKAFKEGLKKDENGPDGN